MARDYEQMQAALDAYFAERPELVRLREERAAKLKASTLLTGQQFERMMEMLRETPARM